MLDTTQLNAQASDAARAASRIFADMLARLGRDVDADAERVLTALFEALREARLEGSVCIASARFEAVYKRLFGQTLTLTAAVRMLERLQCVRVHAADCKEPQTAAPFVADAGPFAGTGEVVRLYSERSFFDELRLAQKISALAGIDGDAQDGGHDEKNADAGADPIIRRALGHRFSVVSGGPGTGKTTAVVKVLYALLQENGAADIVLAAPTGKAAGRMQQAVASGADRLGEGEVVEKLKGLRSQTIHRLLVTPLPDGSMPGSSNPLACDILVVDESSMIDSDLAMRLFDAVDGRRTRVILLGDRFQLAAVGPGSVFSDLSDRNNVLAPVITQLTVSHRFRADKAVGRLAAAVNNGRVQEAFELLEQETLCLEPQDNAVRWHREAPPARTMLTTEARAWLTDMVREMVRAVQKAAAEHPDDPAGQAAEVARVYARYGVLCAHRRGPMSVEAVNRYVDDALTAAGFAGSAWRQIIIRKNDPFLELYNGDIGLVLPSEAPGSEQVYFADAAEGGRFVRLGLLPEYDPAFAVTIHQSQGSEYARVAVLMPPASASNLATRELLYTAVTRVHDERDSAGRTCYGRLDIFCTEEVLRVAVSRSVQREGGLADRLREMNGPAPGAARTQSPA